MYVVSFVKISLHINTSQNVMKVSPGHHHMGLWASHKTQMNALHIGDKLCLKEQRQQTHLKAIATGFAISCMKTMAQRLHSFMLSHLKMHKVSLRTLMDYLSLICFAQSEPVLFLCNILCKPTRMQLICPCCRCTDFIQPEIAIECRN